MHLTLILLLSVLAAAPAPTVLLRFNGKGEAQALLRCPGGAAACTVPSMTQQLALDNFAATLCRDNESGTGYRYCRCDPKYDGSMKATDFVGADMSHWKPLDQIPGFLALTTAQKTNLKGHFKIADDSRPEGSHHGSLKYVAVLNASSQFFWTHSALGDFLQARGLYSARNSVREPLNRSAPAVLPGGQQTRYVFTQTDTFSAAQKEIDRLIAAGNANPKVMVVNFANNDHAGGGYRTGARAQEEDLFRCSTLPWALGPRRSDPNFYPINNHVVGQYNAIYTPDIHIYRKSWSYDFMTEAQVRKYKVSACSVAALNCNDPRDAAYFVDQVSCAFTLEGDRATTARLLKMFEMAKDHQVDSLVLGAFGCGVFRNNPRSIVAKYNVIMATYANAIPNIIYAVIGATNVNVFFDPVNGLQCPLHPITV